MRYCLLTMRGIHISMYIQYWPHNILMGWFKNAVYGKNAKGFVSGYPGGSSLGLFLILRQPPKKEQVELENYNYPIISTGLI